MKETDQVPEVKRLYKIVRQLESRFQHYPRRFTLDGHLVGSIGDVIAASRYDLKLLNQSEKTHDAQTKDRSGKKVQIKTTQRESIGLRHKPDHLIVLSLSQDGHIREVYNGPGKPAWAKAGKEQKNGQRQISISPLRELMKKVSPDSSIRRVH